MIIYPAQCRKCKRFFGWYEINNLDEFDFSQEKEFMNCYHEHDTKIIDRAPKYKAIILHGR
jgi:hypothetical protein